MQENLNRITIIDFNHLVHRVAYFAGGDNKLTIERLIPGKGLVTIDTSIPYYVVNNMIIKNTHFGLRGPVVICMDSPIPLKRDFISRVAQIHADKGCLRPKVMESDLGYKAGRAGRLNKDVYNGMKLSKNIMETAGIQVLQEDNYEADDLVYAAVQAYKKAFPGVMIDILTNDHDMLPLVDETVNVYLRNNKTTVTETGHYDRNKYIEVTASNYEEATSYLSLYSSSKVLIPRYNTSLLIKLLRGDKSDNLHGHKDWTPTKVEKLIQQLQADGHDISNVARYGEFRYSEDGKTILPPLEYLHMIDVLQNYVDENTLEFVKRNYLAMNLNSCLTMGGKVIRLPYQLKTLKKGYDINKLITELGKYDIVKTPKAVLLDIKD